MADEQQREVYIRDSEADVQQTSPEGGVPGLRKHYVLRAETGVLTGLYSGEWDSNRVQGETDEQGSYEISSSQEGQS